jgi:hypothetical protein
MARAFRRKGQRFVAKFDAMEREVVADILDQTRQLVAPPDTGKPKAGTGDEFDQIVASISVGRDGPADPPEDLADRDPALDRLLPVAHRGDEKVAAEFRRLTEHDLRDRKAANLTAAIEALRGATGDHLELNKEQAAAVAVALTDARLVLGERLGLRTDEDAHSLELVVGTLDPEDPVVYAASIYDFLTWMQESLTTAMLGRGLFR